MINGYRLYDLRFLFLVLFVNFVLFYFLGAYLNELIVNVLFNVVRFSVFFYAGWFVFKSTESGLVSVISLAALLAAFDHVFLKGGAFFFESLFDEKISISDALYPFYGVLISYVINVPIAIIFVYMGKTMGSKFFSKNEIS